MERIACYMRVGSYENLDKATLIKILEERDSLIETQKKEIEQMREEIGVATYELEQLERVLDMPTKGYVRNGYNRILRTLQESLKQE